MKKKIKNKKRQKKQQVTTPSITMILSSWWKEKHPALMFVIKFMLLYGFFYTAISFLYYKTNIHLFITQINAHISNFFLNLFGAQTQVINQSTIQSSIFSINIKRGCDAVEAIALFTAAILAFPTTWSKKLIGILGGGFVLFMLNIIRIDSLYWIGTKSKFWFDIMHYDIWQFLFILCTVGLIFFWMQWTYQNKFDTITS